MVKSIVIAVALVAASSAAHADDETPGGFGKPHGSLLYATSVAEFGALAGRAPTGGTVTGLHYAERGGLFANILAAAAPGMAAQAEANRTGRTVTYHQPDPDDFGALGLTVDAYSRSLGGEVSGVATDFFAIIGIGKTLPWSVDIGASFILMSREGDGMTTEAGGVGLYLGVIAPVTRFVQVEARGRLMLGTSLYTVEAGGLAHLSDRFYVRGSWLLMPEGGGPLIGAGVRL